MNKQLSPVTQFVNIFCKDDLSLEDLNNWLRDQDPETLISVMLEIIIRYHNKLYTASTEQLMFNFDNPLVEGLVKAMELADLDSKKEAVKVKGHTRNAKNQETKINVTGLPVENTDIYPEDEDFQKHPEQYKELGSEIVREVVAQSRLFYVRQQTIHVYARTADDGETLIIRGKPTAEKLLENSLVSPELAARIIYNKTLLGLPLYRQAQDFGRKGFVVSRQTLSNWSINTTEQYLFTLADRIHKDLICQNIFHIDETPVRVLHNTKGTKLGNITVSATPQDSPLLIACYVFTPGKDKPSFFESLPEDYSGTIVCDAAPAHKVFASATLQYCMTHADREFKNALKARTDYNQFRKLKTEEERRKYLDDLDNPSLSLLLETTALFARLYHQAVSYRRARKRRYAG